PPRSTLFPYTTLFRSGFDDRGGLGGRVGCGGGFGLEPFYGQDGTIAGAAGGIEAVLEFGEAVRVAGGGPSEGELLGVGVPVLILVSPRLGFGVIEAAEGPLAADEVVDVEALFGVGGVVVEVALLDELLDVGGVLAGGEGGFGVDAGFEVVHGGDGLARDRGGAGGFLGVTTVGFYLTKSRHGFRSVGQADLEG